MSAESETAKKRKRNQIHSEMRNSIIRMLEQGKSIDNVAKVFSLPRSTVSSIRLKHQRAITPSEPHKTNKTNLKLFTFSSDHKKFIDDALSENCMMSIKSLLKRMNENFSTEVLMSDLRRYIGSKFFYTIQKIQKTRDIVSKGEDILWARKRFVMELCEKSNMDKLIVFVETKCYKLEAKIFHENAQDGENDDIYEPIFKKSYSISTAISTTEMLHLEIVQKSVDNDVFQSFFTSLLRKLESDYPLTDITFIVPAGDPDVDSTVERFRNIYDLDIMQIPEESKFLNPLEDVYNQLISVLKSTEPTSIKELESKIRVVANELISPVDINRYCGSICNYFGKCITLKSINV